MMPNKAHVPQSAAAASPQSDKPQNYRVLYLIRSRSSPACLILLPLLFLLLLFFTVSKLPYTDLQTEGPSPVEDSSSCSLRASLFNPFPSSSEARRRRQDGIRGKTRTVNSAGDQLASFPEACKGKLIYVYPLPAEFNEELVERCRVGYRRYCDKWFCIPCNRLENHGFGPIVPQNQTRVTKGLEKEGVRLIPKSAWYRSDQFSVEVIFYEKMKRHRCVTQDADEADAFYIPFYGGLDVGFISFSNHTHIRDELTQRLVGWLTGNPVWQEHKGAPHIMVLGHVAWDFNRKVLEGDGSYDDGSYIWGTSLLHQPLLSNVTFLLIERKFTKHDMGLPFPTLFHPSTSSDVFLWQEEMRKAKRPWLVTFVGGSTRKFTKDASTKPLRRELMRQCKGAEEVISMDGQRMQRCRAVECIGGDDMKWKRQQLELGSKGNRSTIADEIACDEEPEEVVKALAKSVFCLQPRGDSVTRKGFFDSIVAGCIPVLFANGTAYTQYRWHLPASPSLYSIFIPEKDVLASRVNVIDMLSRIPLAEIRSMQQAVRHLIPRVVYSHVSSSLPDAISITLDAFFAHNKAFFAHNKA